MYDIYSNIVFIIKQKKKPYYDSAAITGMKPKLYFKTEKRKILIQNARNYKNFKLDKNGFEFYKYDFNITKNKINENIEVYKDKLSKYLIKKIPFKEIVFFDFTSRSNSKNGAYNNDGQRQPAVRAHVDYTITSGIKRAKDILSKNRYNKLIKDKRRIIQINIWRPLSNIVLSSPLAFADASSIEQADLIATDQRFPDRVGEIYHLAYNAYQQWYWLPKMSSNEFLIFKGWDSSNDKGLVKFTPHTSFNLAKQNVIKNPRESIEARAFLIL
jgi:hypothetical protein